MYNKCSSDCPDASMEQFTTSSFSIWTSGANVKDILRSCICKSTASAMGEDPCEREDVSVFEQEDSQQSGNIHVVEDPQQLDNFSPNVSSLRNCVPSVTSYCDALKKTTAALVSASSHMGSATNVTSNYPWNEPRAMHKKSEQVSNHLLLFVIDKFEL